MEDLHSRDVPEGAVYVLTDLMPALHKNTGATIHVGKNKFARLETTRAVHQGCILAPALFLHLSRLDFEPYGLKT